MIRERLPRATIITFWHIPWPNAERFGICPWRESSSTGCSAASIVGFHTQHHCNNFIDSVDAFMESRIDREHNAVVQQRAQHAGSRPTRSRSSGPSAGATARPSPECRASVFGASSACAPDALLGVGVDRLDYTKGIEERLLAVERLLERYPEFRGRFTFVQLAAPSRTKIDRYRSSTSASRRSPQRINERFGDRRLPADRPAAARTTSRRRCSGTTAPPTSAT